MNESTTTTSLLGDVLRELQALGVVPWWAVLLAAVLLAVVVVLWKRYGLGAIARKVWGHLRSIPMDPPPVPPGEIGGEVYPGHTPSPPMDMPEGGMVVPGPPDKDLEP